VRQVRILRAETKRPHSNGQKTLDAAAFADQLIRALGSRTPPSQRPGLQAPRVRCSERVRKRPAPPPLSWKSGAPRTISRAQARLPARQNPIDPDVAVGGIWGDGAPAAVDGGGRNGKRLRRRCHPTASGHWFGEVGPRFTRCLRPATTRADDSRRSNYPKRCSCSDHLLGTAPFFWDTTVPIKRRFSAEALKSPYATPRATDRQDLHRPIRQDPPRRFGGRFNEMTSSRRWEDCRHTSGADARPKLDPGALRDRRVCVTCADRRHGRACYGTTVTAGNSGAKIRLGFTTDPAKNAGRFATC